MTHAAWIDTHCHLDEFIHHGGAAHADAERRRAAQAGVAHCVLPAVEQANFAAVRELAQHHGDSYALGIHPLFTEDAGEDDLAALEHALAQHAGDPHLVAIGEIGLDGFVKELDWERQQQLWRAQLRLARQHDLPVIVHSRHAVDQVLKGLRELPVRGGIAHAFNGSEQQARILVEMGFKLGFGGAATFERAHRIRHLAQVLPLEALVLETDAPDIPPHWLYVTAAERAAGVPPARNSPAELPRIGAVIAELRGMAADELAEASRANACAALPRLQGLLS
ncbi:TatD DNase family protein [Oryzisolibacter propanilivorax]|uniref:TatD DNase family protein n=1 Tax=Oryzisolibacter propanilivorax TaxID=1527607 RepID=A0A1G9UYC0_9BURK|nr:TatD family hydrolase [Oryzisolibacter propanilivorax]SDM64817.1 TatD DNase family protein [Oryzisolibacter propanilivorax]